MGRRVPHGIHADVGAMTERTNSWQIDDLPLVPSFSTDWALFLDVDGTLLEIAQEPHYVVLPGRLAETLEALDLRVPLALVSGRRIANLDRLFAPLTLAAAGQHGSERRSADGSLRYARVSKHVLDRARKVLQRWSLWHPGTLVEDKGLTVALHYRRAPWLRVEAERAMQEAMQQVTTGYELVAGKMVYEIRPAGWNKGRAIKDFMQEKPFSGHRPIFVGDDVVDEDAFIFVNSLGGYSFKVGEGPTSAQFRFADVYAVHHWLERFARWLSGARPNA
jgi:trehalose 6-phosphate phosphatase